MSTPDPAFSRQDQDGGAPASGSLIPDLGPESRAPADVLTPLNWSDLVLLVIFYIACGALLYFLVASVASLVFHLPSATLRTPTAASVSVDIVAQALLSFATLAFLYLRVRLRTSLPFWPAVGWRPLHGVASRAVTIIQYVLLGMGLALAASLAGRYLDNGATVPFEEFFRSRQSVLLLTGLGILVAPLVEETIFRGCIYPVIARRWGVPAGITVTGTLFGLAHAEQLWGAWGQIAVLISVGLVLTYIRARAATVVASYFVHLGYNTILFAAFYFATGGLRYFPGT